MLFLLKFWKRFIQLNLFAVAGLTFIVVFLSGWVIHLIEPETFPSVVKDGVWYVMTTMTTVGYGDYAPKTLAGRVFGMLLYVYGIGLMTMFIGKAFDSISVKRRLKEEGKVSYKKNGHYIFIGWGKKTETAIREVLCSNQTAEIVLIDQELDKVPVEDGRVHFVKGDASDEEILSKANLLGAKSVAIFSDEKIPDALSADGKTALIALSVEGYATSRGMNIYTTVELRKSSHQKQLQHAKVDAFVPSSDSVALLMARETLYQGSSNLFNQMLSQQHGADWYEIQPHPNWKTYQEAALGLWSLGANLLAVNDTLEVAKQGQTPLHESDRLYIVCNEAVYREILNLNSMMSL